jgi:hypothetical protein
VENYHNTCPMSQQALIDEYFMEYRAKLIAVAAFMDRMERSTEQNGEEDFRFKALKEAIDVLSGEESDKVYKMQMIFTDRDATLLDERDRQAAYGAANPAIRETPTPAPGK